MEVTGHPAGGSLPPGRFWGLVRYSWRCASVPTDLPGWLYNQKKRQTDLTQSLLLSSYNILLLVFLKRCMELRTTCKIKSCTQYNTWYIHCHENLCYLSSWWQFAVRKIKLINESVLPSPSPRESLRKMVWSILLTQVHHEEKKKKDSFAEDIHEMGNQQLDVPTMGFRALATQALNAEFNTHKN